MDTATVERQLQAISNKLDAVQAELAAQGRRQAELEELKDDLSLILRDMTQAAIVELDDVTPFVQTGDVLALVKKILRNTNRIAEGLDQLESAADFLADARPLSRDVFQRFVAKLDELEAKGYFRVGGELQGALDALVRVLDRHNAAAALRRSLELVGEASPEELGSYSLWRIYRTTRQPEMQKLLGRLMSFLKAFAGELAAAPEIKQLETRR